jgi:hypothetical protein
VHKGQAAAETILLIVQKAGMVPARERRCERAADARFPDGATSCAAAVSAFSPIQFLRLIVGYKLLA